MRDLRSYRLTASITAAVLLAGPLAASGHYALVEHTVCPEHGEILHADEGPAEASTHEALPPGVRQAPARHPGSSHEVDHCLAPATLPGPSVISPVPSPVGVGKKARRIPTPSVLPLASVALLRQAPKTSPPAPLS